MHLLRVFDLISAPAIAFWSLCASTAEAARPLRRRVVPRLGRYLSNAKIAAGAGVVVRLAVLPAMVATARAAERRGFGVVRWLGLPGLVGTAAAMVALDWGIYWWHRKNHEVPALWKRHLIHHQDVDLDVSTAFRFDALEVLFSVPVRCAQVALAGASPGAVVAYETLLQLMTVFHHSNLDLGSLDDWLRPVVVTPCMHGTHHSVVERELQSNWGVVFSVWDRLHGSFRAEGDAHGVVVGLASDWKTRRES